MSVILHVLHIDVKVGDYTEPIPESTIIEPHGRGVPEAILNGRSPPPGLPE